MRFLLMLVTAAAIQTASGGELKFQSREGQHVPLVELYTSEGCSSCPPAETWLSRLKDSPQLWTEIVPVAFHVDYWDNLGWRDRFAAPAWTARQRAYAAAWGGDSVYTPGFVLDGCEWRGWSGGTVPATGKVDGAGRLSVTVRDGKTVTVVYHPTERLGARSAREVSVALLASGLGSDVKAGENRGRSLRHDFVALSCETKKLSTVSGQSSEESATFELPAPRVESGRPGLAVWVGEAGRVSQATGGWLD